MYREGEAGEIISRLCGALDWAASSVGALEWAFSTDSFVSKRSVSARYSRLPLVISSSGTKTPFAVQHLRLHMYEHSVPLLSSAQQSIISESRGYLPYNRVVRPSIHARVKV